MTKEVKMVLEVPGDSSVLLRLWLLLMRLRFASHDPAARPQDRQIAEYGAAITEALLLRRVQMYGELQSQLAQRRLHFDHITFMNAWITVQRERSNPRRNSFRSVLNRESIGGNAGRNCAAVNMIVDRDNGELFYAGNNRHKFGQLPANLVEATARVRLLEIDEYCRLHWRLDKIFDHGRLSRTALLRLKNDIENWLK